jgi:hypothetical protein
MFCVAIESSYRLNLVGAARSLPIDHVPQAAQRAVKAGRWYERVTSAEFDIDRIPRTVRVVEEKIRLTWIDRVYADELKPLGR